MRDRDVIVGLRLGCLVRAVIGVQVHEGGEGLCCGDENRATGCAVGHGDLVVRRLRCWRDEDSVGF